MGAFWDQSRGIAGSTPRFELSEGWLTAMPSEEWPQFQQGRRPSCAVFVGETLGKVLRTGDEIDFARNDLCKHQGRRLSLQTFLGNDFQQWGLKLTLVTFGQKLRPGTE